MSYRVLLQTIESMLRSEGCKTKAESNNVLLFKCIHEDVEYSFALEIDSISGYMRISLLTDYAYEGDYKNISAKNFELYGIKVAIDPEGYLAFIAEIPLICLTKGGIDIILNLINLLEKTIKLI
ncbi:hypothetical protein [Fervidicoccus fontis]|uniref:Uncharacterized protein n=1 Tax=Fervidicoccus fontis TaxID=683846 RepID=A0A2J6N2G6_9CREN|nr:hypothetical protein [Fervidicoccus fontis]PMB75413.1 MAG: hypothetical protein C0188_03195 [Fervidicoccus fontis]PMB76689.1 MAG: hypothetical protein C0177_05415 [Fervidicoccus fontis]HEW63996.1 hypothetical protein [Fervidicoccus fontis]